MEVRSEQEEKIAADDGEEGYERRGEVRADIVILP
jgi:hypothetical protein